MNSASGKLSTFDLTIVVISLVIGMGIFRTPSEVAGYSGTSTIFFLAWAAGALVSYFGALTFAEIGSRYPATGGFYKIFSFCYSPVFAFMVNWITVISNAASTAAVAIMGSEYLSDAFGIPSEFAIYLALSTVLILLVVNLIGIQISKTVLNVLMLIKILFILLLIACVFFPHANEHVASTIPNRNSNSLEAFVLCFVPVFFTYGGYQQTMNFGGDVSLPNKTLPKAISRGILVIMLLYLAVNYSYFNVLGLDGVAQSKTLAADTIGATFGQGFAKVIALIMFFAVTAYVNVSILSNPRVYYAMAEDKVMPAFFLKTSAKSRVLTNGMIVFCLLILLTLFFVDSFQKILQFVMFFDSISLVAAASAIFILRKRMTGEEQGQSIYRLKAYPWFPLIYILIYTAVNVSVLIANPYAFFWGAVLFVLGYPLFYFLRIRLSK
jgi:APA family basic amino acid/polyamine antiporter